MKLGVLLPTFREQATDALAVAAEVVDRGLDGVFAYDHLYPMGSPDRPALAPFPVLARVASRHPTLDVGPLVARVGLGSPATLVAAFRALAAITPGHVIAALGTGDSLSRAENEAYGLTYDDPTTRRSQLDEVLRAVVGFTEVSVGAGSEATNELARRRGVALNVWQKEPSAFPTGAPLTWAGRLDEDVATHLDRLASAGVTYVVGVPGTDLGALAQWRESRGFLR